jgi:hypothetical protein
MAISYPVSFPSIPIQQMTIRARSVVGVSASPFTGQQQVYQHQGQWWEAEVSLPPMKRADAEQVIAFLLKLNGRYGTFTLGDPANTAPRGIGTGTPLVRGASQTGNELITDGWTTSQTGILKAGDWIQLGSGSTSRMYKVLDDANSDASGIATLTLWPNLRSSPNDNDTVTISSPKGLWRLSANEMPYTLDEASIYGITFACVEAL